MVVRHEGGRVERLPKSKVDLWKRGPVRWTKAPEGAGEDREIERLRAGYAAALQQAAAYGAEVGDQDQYPGYNENWSWHYVAAWKGLMAAAKMEGTPNAEARYPEALEHLQPDKLPQVAWVHFGFGRLARSTAWVNETANYYEVSGLQKAWARFYRKPGKGPLGRALRATYTRHLRAYVRRNMPMVAALLRHDRAAARAALKSVTDGCRANTRADFKQQAYVAYEARKFSGDSYLFMAILRRELDGTLPVLRAMFAQALADYDPQMWARYKGDLVSKLVPYVPAPAP